MYTIGNLAHHLTVKLSLLLKLNDKYSCQFVGSVSVMCAKHMLDLSIVLQALPFCSLQYMIVLMSMTACRQGEVLCERGELVRTLMPERVGCSR